MLLSKRTSEALFQVNEADSPDPANHFARWTLSLTTRFSIKRPSQSLSLSKVGHHGTQGMSKGDDFLRGFCMAQSLGIKVNSAVFGLFVNSSMRTER